MPRKEPRITKGCAALRDFVTRKNMTYEQAGALVDIDGQTLHRYVRGYIVPDHAKAVLLQDVLGVNHRLWLEDEPGKWWEE